MRLNLPNFIESYGNNFTTEYGEKLFGKLFGSKEPYLLIGYAPWEVFLSSSIHPVLKFDPRGLWWWLFLSVKVTISRGLVGRGERQPRSCAVAA